ncbi:catechol 2,3-dioxygenase-like lactoylglutathione lyase family enzyme [Spinactinospora alkalitolerans]|uniref:Catechol 2,3-dioxygenase-like lactoylglutathione lyase family enzyme n=1 Tax=Spinactinospora alkalitolerans TaxID=687207 RepID=A0A852U8D2_9ACTN|nr:catechol 2,3-dioxygenase-like lactoylglutathione lyase family enzyme [Spinactinospora alkalitolerans]
MPHLGLVTLVVRDYDEAVAFYVNAVGFELIEDTRISDEKRWVVVGPPGARETAVLLARAATPEQAARIGDQTGGRVGWFLNTEDFDRDHERMRAAGVVFEEPPRHEPYGTVAVFRDPYGNRWDLIGPRRDRGADGTGSGAPGRGEPPDPARWPTSEPGGTPVRERTSRVRWAWSA